MEPTLSKRVNESVNKNMIPPNLREEAFNHLRHVYKFLYERFDGQLPESWEKDMKYFS